MIELKRKKKKIVINFIIILSIKPYDPTHDDGK